MKHLAQIKEPYLKKTKNEQYHYDEYIDRMERPQGKHKKKTMKRERSPTMCLKQYNHIEEGRRMSLKNYVQNKRQSLQVLKRTTKLSGKSPKTRLKKLPAQLKEKNLVLTETEPQRRWPWRNQTKKQNEQYHYEEDMVEQKDPGKAQETI